MATLKEIADKVGVSVTTVSRVINYDETLSISPDKRKLIFEVAEELEYETPRSKKRVNSTKKIKPSLFRVGIIHFISVDEELEDPYYLSIRIGIEKKCQEYNYEIVKLFAKDGEYPIEQLKNIHGLLAIGKFSTADVRLFQSCCSNIVFVDSCPLEEELDSVVVDVDVAMNKILAFALAQGFTRIGFCGWLENYPDSRTYLGEKRYTAFVEYMEKKNLLNNNYIYLDALYSKSRGAYHLFKDAFEKGDLPELIIAGNDSVAIGIMKAIHETGLRIPEDISIIGINDIPIAQYTFPPLTTVKFYSEIMGETAVSLLKERFEHRKIAKKVTFPCQLVIRESCRLAEKASEES